MKESRLIIGTNTIALMVFLLMLLLGETSISNSSGIIVILLFLSIGLTLAGMILTFVHWKRIGSGTRVLGILPFLIWIIVVAFFLFGLKNMD